MAAVAPPQTLPTTTTNGSSSSPETEYQRDVRQLVDLLSKLNPSAKEFFPSSYPAPADGVTSDVKNSPSSDGSGSRRLSADAPIFVASTDYYNNNNNIYSPNSNSSGSSDGSAGYQLNRRKRRINGYASQGGRRRMMNEMARRAEREESIRRTVYVSDIDHHVTEEHLADLFANCGQVIDCRICGDPHSVLRFAFIEFADEDGARAALNLGGTMLGFYPVRVLPSKTAILPVNPKFLPRSNDEREMVGRTVYCTNIDKKVTPSDVKIFFQQRCGEVSRLRLLGDNVHSTRIAFVEFALAESAIAALNCSGMFLGTLPVRVSPSKTPVRPRVPRAASH